MRKLLVILLASFICHHLTAQSFSDTVLTRAEQMPYFAGCDESLNVEETRRHCSNQKMAKFLSTFLVYPEEAKMKGIQGTVLVGFIVDERGEVQNASILNDIGAGCGQAALDVVEQMPRWEPARQDGKKVKVRLNLPIQFYLRAGELDRAERFSLTWGNLKNKTVTTEELLSALNHAVHVRGPEGDSRFVDELEFLFEKKGRIISGTGRGLITPELEEVVAKSKRGGIFTIRASIQEGGDFVSIYRTFRVIE